MNLWALSVFDVNFVRANHYECEFYEKWAFANVDSMRAKHCKFDFYEIWALQMWVLWELSFSNVDFMRAEFANVNFMGAEHCEFEYDFMRADLCECAFCESWAL